MDKVIDKNACAYKEIYEILKMLPKELVNAIPIKLIKFFYDNMDKNHKFNVTKESIEENMLEETKVILAILFRDYWATQEQKEKILNFQEQEYKKYEKEIEEKYCIDNLFKNKTKTEENQTIQNEIALVNQKEKLLTKLIKKIKSIFNLKK